MDEPVTPPQDLNTLEHAERLVDDLFDHADRMLRRYGSLTPLCHLIVTRDPQGTLLEEPGAAVVVPTKLGSADEKDGFVEFLKEKARELRAIGLAMAIESWIAWGLQGEEFKRAVREGISAHPKRQEVVMVFLEHQRLDGGRAWMAPILRNLKGKPFLGERQKLPAGAYDGRFANVLPDDIWS